MEQEKSFVRGPYESREYFAERALLTMREMLHEKLGHVLSDPEKRAQAVPVLANYFLRIEASHAPYVTRVTGVRLTLNDWLTKIGINLQSVTVGALYGENPTDPGKNSPPIFLKDEQKPPTLGFMADISDAPHDQASVHLPIGEGAEEITNIQGFRFTVRDNPMATPLYSQLRVLRPSRDVFCIGQGFEIVIPAQIIDKSALEGSGLTFSRDNTTPIMVGEQMYFCRFITPEAFEADLER